MRKIITYRNCTFILCEHRDSVKPNAVVQHCDTEDCPNYVNNCPEHGEN